MLSSAKASSQYAKQIIDERPIAKFVPYSSHIDDRTIMTKDGDLMRIWNVAGISFETVDEDIIKDYKNRLNQLYRSISSQHVSIWTHTVRRKFNDRLDGTFSDDFSRNLNEKYFKSFENYGMMKTELYFTLIYRPPKHKLEKAFDKFFNLFSRKKQESSIDKKLSELEEHKERIKRYQRKALSEMDKLSRRVEVALNDYGQNRVEGIERLGTYQKDNVEHSSILEFLNFLLTGNWQPVRTTKVPLDLYLGNAWIHAGTEMIEIRTPSDTRYAQAIDFKDYPKFTEPGMLNALMMDNYEFVITQSFSFKEKADAKFYLEQTQKQLINTEDASEEQIEELTDALNDLTSGDFVLGEYHFSMMIFDHSVEDLKDHVTQATIKLQDAGFMPTLVAIATDATFYAQLPCNWNYRPRLAKLTSRNFAGLSAMHNFKTGKRDRNPWGEALTILKTESKQPLYFNYHFAKPEEDAIDKKLSGNTLILGTTGSGKTVLMNFLHSQSQKYKQNPAGFSTVFLDYDRGGEIYIRRIGGTYFRIKNGIPTGLNPLTLEPNNSNIEFVRMWIEKLVTANDEVITVDEREKIHKAIQTVMLEMPVEERSLSYVLQNIQEGTSAEEKVNSLYKRLAVWCRFDRNDQKGAYWWVFDDCLDEYGVPKPNVDKLDFTIADNIGIDGTEFLNNKLTRTVVSMYLLYRMESIIDGRRFIYDMDECWRWIVDAVFSEFAGNKQLTIRKQGGLGVFATQMPSSILKSPIAAQLIQQCITKIFLPNPNAVKEEYVNGFGLSETEYDIIKSLSPSDRTFLIKQDNNSHLAQLDLTGFNDELDILSGSTDNIEILDNILEEYGEDISPEIWEPIFRQKIIDRRLSIRSN